MLLSWFFADLESLIEIIPVWFLTKPLADTTPESCHGSPRQSLAHWLVDRYSLHLWDNVSSFSTHQLHYILWAFWVARCHTAVHPMHWALLHEYFQIVILGRLWLVVRPIPLFIYAFAAIAASNSQSQTSSTDRSKGGSGPGSAWVNIGGKDPES